MDNTKSGFERNRSDAKLISERKNLALAGSSSATPELNRFKGKNFYFDDECQREINFKGKLKLLKINNVLKIDLVRWLKYIGAEVEAFHTNKITHYISKSGRKPEAEKPGPARRPNVPSRALSRKDLMLAAVKGAKSAR